MSEEFKEIPVWLSPDIHKLVQRVSRDEQKTMAAVCREILTCELLRRLHKSKVLLGQDDGKPYVPETIGMFPEDAGTPQKRRKGRQ